VTFVTQRAGRAQRDRTQLRKRVTEWRKSSLAS